MNRKHLSYALVGMLFAMGDLQAEDRIKFHLSADVARKVNAHPSDIYVTEFGDAEGPFKQIGSVVLNSSGLHSLSTSVDGSIEDLSPGIDDPHTLLHVEFFVSEKGNGFGVIHKRPVEDSAPVKEAEPEDERPPDHVALCEAAKLAIPRGNTELLKSLLQAGFSIDLPLDVETGWTALHYSAVHNAPRAARMLVENGAYLETRCKFGKRPIDYAFEDGAKELCEILRKPEKDEHQISGYSRDLLDELFHEPSTRDDGVRFLSINSQDPSDKLLEYFRRFWPNVRRRSNAEEIDRAAQPEARTSYRDLKTKDYGVIVELGLKDTGGGTFEWSRREATGPALSGGGARGQVSKQYGYWLKHDTSSWDE